MRGIPFALLLMMLCLPAASLAAAQANESDDSETRETSSSKADTVASRGAQQTRLQFGAAYEHVSNGHRPWRSATLALHAAGRTGGSRYAVVQETMRFSQLDHDVMAGLLQRLTSRLIVALDLGSMTLERYVGRYRAAYVVYVSRLGGGETSASHRVHGDLYYGRLSSSVGLSVSAGEEVENVPPLDVVRTPVRAVAVVGRQWLTPRWFVVYDTLIHEQRTFYTRRVSASLGHQF